MIVPPFSNASPGPLANVIKSEGSPSPSASPFAKPPACRRFANAMASRRDVTKSFRSTTSAFVLTTRLRISLASNCNSNAPKSTSLALLFATFGRSIVRSPPRASVMIPMPRTLSSPASTAGLLAEALSAIVGTGPPLSRSAPPVVEPLLSARMCSSVFSKTWSIFAFCTAGLTDASKAS